MDAWEKQVANVASLLVGRASAQVARQSGGQSQGRSLVEQRAGQLMALAAEGDRPGMDRLLRSWPESGIRQVVAELERR
ncbi:hypothetical protein ACIQWR_38940 [Streptomyces sp. NPDC098789]|uniref:hypothetical protein n=1 Tax=Streptomyces sp. NPDC098789 TaxID=3366098 RepID=UPI0037F424B9